MFLVDIPSYDSFIPENVILNNFRLFINDADLFVNISQVSNFSI